MRKEWQRREEIVDTGFLEKMQQLGKRKINDSFIGTRIEYLSEFYLVGEGNMKEICWCGGVVENISDDTRVKPVKCCQYYKENEAAFVFLNAVPEVDYPASRLIELFDEKNWNRNYDGSRRKELSAVDHGL